jgi:hypothetical protein
MCIMTASTTRSMTATAEAVFWQAIEAFVVRARITSLVLRPGIALARIKTGVPSQFLVTMPRDGAIIFADLIGKLDVPYRFRTIKGVVENQKSQSSGSHPRSIASAVIPIIEGEATVAAVLSASTCVPTSVPRRSAPVSSCQRYPLETFPRKSCPALPPG